MPSLHIVFEFLLKHHCIGSAAMIGAEHIIPIHRIEMEERSGHLCVEIVRTAFAIWRREVHRFNNLFGAPDDNTTARLMQELADKGMQQFVADLTVELQIDHTPKSETE